MRRSSWPDGFSDELAAQHLRQTFWHPHDRTGLSGGGAEAHGRWLASIGREVDQPGLRVAVDEAYGAVLAVQARRDRLDTDPFLTRKFTGDWAGGGDPSR
jgi:hypothetical protein